jgi:AcrR family transcriptional regulator
VAKAEAKKTAAKKTAAKKTAAAKRDGGADMTRSIELLWGPQERPSRGPKPGLSRERIAQAAIELADAEGLAAVSMQRVAAGFGFTTMSLYRYVPGKTELIALMVDTAVGEPPDLSAIPGGWRPKLAEWARLTWHAFQRHPWFMEAAMGTVMGPQQLGWLEKAVAAMAGTGLAGREVLEAVLTVNGHVRSIAPFAGAPPASEGPELGGTEWVGAVQIVIEHNRERFPALYEVVTGGGFASAGDEDPLEFGLQRILDGIDALIAERTGRRHRS